MKCLFFSLICFLLSMRACSPDSHDKKCYHEPDTSVKGPQAYTDKIPIILNRPPLDSDIDSFITNKTPESFKDLCFHFLKADLPFEDLPYALIAVDKYNISNGCYEVACCLTNCLSYLSLSDHSEEIASHFLKRGSSSDSLCAEKYKSLSKRKNYAKLWLPKENSKDSVVTFKTNTLLGSAEDYDKLKKVLFNKKKYAPLLYYSFIMADRYHYTPARKEIREVLESVYKQYKLGDMGKETRYFCSFFDDCHEIK